MLEISGLTSQLFDGSIIQGPGFRCYNQVEVDEYLKEHGLYAYYDRSMDTYRIFPVVSNYQRIINKITGKEESDRSE